LFFPENFLVTLSASLPRITSLSPLSSWHGDDDVGGVVVHVGVVVLVVVGVGADAVQVVVVVVDVVVDIHDWKSRKYFQLSLEFVHIIDTKICN
jgi:hypothetical protein